MMRLTNHGLRVINPLEFAWTETDFNFDDAIELADSSDQRVRRALDLIDQSDGLLANIERANYGTAMEIFYAHRRGKLVTVVGAAPFSPWVLSHSQARFADIDMALRYIIGNQPSLSPYRLGHPARESAR
jgi:nucleoside 2-deoxyribosyltransferase